MSFNFLSILAGRQVHNFATLDLPTKLHQTSLSPNSSTFSHKYFTGKEQCSIKFLKQPHTIEPSLPQDRDNTSASPSFSTHGVCRFGLPVSSVSSCFCFLCFSKDPAMFFPILHFTQQKKWIKLILNSSALILTLLIYEMGKKPSGRSKCLKPNDQFIWREQLLFMEAAGISLHWGSCSSSWPSHPL